MKNIGKIVAISAILGFLIVMVFPVNALPARFAQMSGDAGERQFSHLDRLEEQGYDLSEVRAAIESGDYETARTLMQQFMEEHRDELPVPPEGDRAGKGERMSGHLDRLEEQGYDLSEVRAAIESGDYETARTLMQQFMEEHRDELPVPPEGDRAGNGERMSGHLDRLEEQGYDLSEVRAAIESGDYETARTLMQQFMEEHRDELPVPPEGDRAGKGERMRPGMAS